MTGINKKDVAVYQKLVEYAGGTGVYPGHDIVAEKLGIQNPETVRVCIETLERKKYIRRIFGTQNYIEISASGLRIHCPKRKASGRKAHAPSQRMKANFGQGFRYYKSINVSHETFEEQETAQ